MRNIIRMEEIDNKPREISRKKAKDAFKENSTLSLRKNKTLLAKKSNNSDMRNQTDGKKVWKT